LLPLLTVKDGFITCVIAAATAAALPLTLVVHALGRYPGRRSVSQASSPGQGKQSAEPMRCSARPACEQ
jgi:hypothetical protein